MFWQFLPERAVCVLGHRAIVLVSSTYFMDETLRFYLMCKAEGRSHVSMTNGWPVCGSVLICILSTENCTHLRCVNVHRVQTGLVVQFTCILLVQVLRFLFFYCVLILIKLIQRFRIWSIETLMINTKPWAAQSNNILISDWYIWRWRDLFSV